MIQEGKELYIISLFSIVINAHLGEIIGVLWDNECVTCYDTCYEYTIPEHDRIGGGPTQESNCRLTKEECDQLGGCDPEIFISWLGTDLNDNAMYSAS